MEPEKLKNMSRMEALRELRNRYSNLIDFIKIVKESNCEFYLEECEIIHKFLDETIKGDSILEEAISDIALFPEEPGDDAKHIADSMRLRAITALDEIRNFRY